jgi:hypothetical protein
MEDIFAPKVITMLSVTYLLVALSLAATGDILGGPPLCYSSCYNCLSKWKEAVMSDPVSASHNRMGCGFHNGRELLSFYTMTLTSFMLFATVLLLISLW